MRLLRRSQTFGWLVFGAVPLGEAAIMAGSVALALALAAAAVYVTRPPKPAPGAVWVARFGDRYWRKMDAEDVGGGAVGAVLRAGPDFPDIHVKAVLPVDLRAVRMAELRDRLVSDISEFDAVESQFPGLHTPEARGERRAAERDAQAIDAILKGGQQ